MKRILKIVAMAVVAAAALCSCAKEGPGRFKGNYSFKTSGTVSVREKGNEEAEAFTLKLPDEQGQMDILEAEGNGMLVTMNILSGGVVVFNAEAEGKTITLLPEERVLSVKPGVVQVNMTVTVEGSAHRYGDSVIFDLAYTGKYEELGIEYEITGSDVKCVAKLN